MGTTFVKERLDSADLSFYFFKFDRDDERVRNFLKKNSQIVRSEEEKFEYMKKVIELCVVDDISNIIDVDYSSISEDSMFPLFIKELYLRSVRLNPFLKCEEKIDLNKKTDTSTEKEKEEGLEISYGDIFQIQKQLKEKIIGQDFVIDALCKELIKREIGLNNPEKPPSYFLLGQTGVGKTFFVEMLTQAIYGNTDRLLKINCSKYSQDHEIANLIGAPKGYVGSKDKGIFARHLSKYPDSIILFDEIEKASQKLFELLLPIMDKGEITDNNGNIIDFDRTMIFFTSNIGCDGSIKKEFDGYLDLNSDKLKGKKKEYARYIYLSLKKKFAPEFLNRLKDIFVFNYLKPEDIKRILQNEIEKINQRLKKNKMELIFTPKAINQLAKDSYSDQYGARELERTVDRLVINPLAEAIYLKEFKKGDTIEIDYQNKEYVFRRRKETKRKQSKK